MSSLTSSQMDTIKEIINIGVGKAANLLNSLISSHIDLKVPELKVITIKELITEVQQDHGEVLSAVSLPFSGGFSGIAKLIFPTESAGTLVSVFIDEEDGNNDLDTLKIGTLSEIGNIVLNSLLGTISNFLNINLNYTPPNYLESEISDLLYSAKTSITEACLYARTNFLIRTLEISGDFVLIFELGSLNKLIEMIDQYFAAV